MESRYDVIISGAGPSGSLLGYLLSGKGINTLIIEKQTFPRYKICAGGLQHRSIDLFPFNIGKVLQKSLHGICFSFRGRDVFMKKYDLPIIHTVDRREFDSFLAEKAKENGCTLNFDETVTGYELEEGGIRINTDKSSYRGKILAGADGIRGIVHRKLTSGSKILKILGYETEKRADGTESKKYDDVFGLDFGGTKKGYVWAFPKKDLISYGIGGPFSTAAAMKEYFKVYMNGKKEDCMAELKAQSIPVRTENTPICSYRILAVGDAACLGDGFSGEGIYNALGSSRIAAESIEHALKSSIYNFEDYHQKIVDEIYKDIKISLTFSRIFFSYPMFFYKLLKTNDKFFNLCCQVLRGKKKYSDISGRLNLFGR
jgi:geranylgeranyl reductase family protein